MIGDVLGDAIAVVHVDGLQTLFLVDEGHMAVSPKEIAGQQKTLCRRRAEGALDHDHGHQVCVGVVQLQEMVDVRFDPFGDEPLEFAVEPLLHLSIVVSQRHLAPIQRRLPGHHDVDASGHSTLRIEVNIPRTRRDVLLVHLLRGRDKELTLGALADAGSIRVAPMQNLGELPEQQEANLAILTGLHSELQNTMATLAHAREQEAYLQSLLSQYENMAASQAAVSGPGDTSLQDTYRAQLTRLRKEKADLLAKYTAEYPDVVKVNEQIRETEALLAASTQAPKPTKEGTAAEKSKSVRPVENNAAIAQVKSQLEANRLEIQNATEDAKQIEARIDEYQRRLNLTPVREGQLAELLRGYDQAKQRYDDLSSKRHNPNWQPSLEIRQQGQRFTMY